MAGRKEMETRWIVIVAVAVVAAAVAAFLAVWFTTPARPHATPRPTGTPELEFKMDTRPSPAQLAKWADTLVAPSVSGLYREYPNHDLSRNDPPVLLGQGKPPPFHQMALVTSNALLLHYWTQHGDQAKAAAVAAAFHNIQRARGYDPNNANAGAGFGARLLYPQYLANTATPVPFLYTDTLHHVPMPVPCDPSFTYPDAFGSSGPPDRCPSNPSHAKAAGCCTSTAGATTVVSNCRKYQTTDRLTHEPVCYYIPPQRLPGDNEVVWTPYTPDTPAADVDAGQVTGKDLAPVDMWPHLEATCYAGMALLAYAEKFPHATQGLAGRAAFLLSYHLWTMCFVQLRTTWQFTAANYHSALDGRVDNAAYAYKHSDTDAYIGLPPMRTVGAKTSLAVYAHENVLYWIWTEQLRHAVAHPFPAADAVGAGYTAAQAAEQVVADVTGFLALVRHYNPTADQDMCVSLQVAFTHLQPRQHGDRVTHIVAAHDGANAPAADGFTYPACTQVQGGHAFPSDCGSGTTGCCRDAAGQPLACGTLPNNSKVIGFVGACVDEKGVVQDVGFDAPGGAYTSFSAVRTAAGDYVTQPPPGAGAQAVQNATDANHYPDCDDIVDRFRYPTNCTGGPATVGCCRDAAGNWVACRTLPHAPPDAVGSCRGTDNNRIYHAVHYPAGTVCKMAGAGRGPLHDAAFQGFTYWYPGLRECQPGSTATGNVQPLGAEAASGCYEAADAQGHRALRTDTWSPECAVDPPNEVPMLLYLMADDPSECVRWSLMYTVANESVPDANYRHYDADTKAMVGNGCGSLYDTVPTPCTVTAAGLQQAQIRYGLTYSGNGDGIDIPTTALGLMALLKMWSKGHRDQPMAQGFDKMYKSLLADWDGVVARPTSDAYGEVRCRMMWGSYRAWDFLPFQATNTGWRVWRHGFQSCLLAHVWLGLLMRFTGAQGDAAGPHEEWNLFRVPAALATPDAICPADSAHAQQCPHASQQSTTEP